MAMPVSLGLFSIASSTGAESASRLISPVPFGALDCSIKFLGLNGQFLEGSHLQQLEVVKRSVVTPYLDFRNSREKLSVFDHDCFQRANDPPHQSCLESSLQKSRNSTFSHLEGSEWAKVFFTAATSFRFRNDDFF